ncbi:hypothetical protein ACM67B_09050 [Neisseria sp. CCUG17229]|uniref:hypothetical protein n=1 Tax=Neisseria sp. CCUG17229 TaxID=3392036 RepID=UPI003A1035C3
MNQDYQTQLKQAVEKIREAEVIIIGGASGLSTANGHDFYNHSDYFKKHFTEFEQKFGVTGCFQALYHRYPNRQSRWAYLSKHATAMFDEPAGQTYLDLRKLVGDKSHFVITTNQDMQFSKVFDEDKIAYPQGDAHWLQCSKPCHDAVYPAEEAVRKMAASIEDCAVNPATIPTCPNCGADLEPWIRSYEFLEGTFWAEKLAIYQDFVVKNHNKKILFIEMGVGRMTPNIIKYPFSKMANLWPNAFLIRINQKEDFFPAMKEGKAVIFDHDIAATLRDLVALKNQQEQNHESAA